MNPYKILGVSPNASDDEIKEAYRELAKKYHPDKYKDNPLGDLAAEKMKEVNEAYDLIKKQRAGGAGQSSSYSSSSSYGSSAGYQQSYSGEYAQVRRYIDAGNLAEAERILNAASKHNAEWHFLKGAVAMRRSMYNEAYSHFRTAMDMDPGNMEYRNAYMRMNMQANQYRNMGGGMNDAQCCNCCGNLICADCCCECMGGDLIPCC